MPQWSVLLNLPDYVVSDRDEEPVRLYYTYALGETVQEAIDAARQDAMDDHTDAEGVCMITTPTDIAVLLVTYGVHADRKYDAEELR